MSGTRRIGAACDAAWDAHTKLQVCAHWSFFVFATTLTRKENSGTPGFRFEWLNPARDRCAEHWSFFTYHDNNTEQKTTCEIGAPMQIVSGKFYETRSAKDTAQRIRVSQWCHSCVVPCKFTTTKGALTLWCDI